MTAFQAEFVELQQVKTRSVYKIVLEIPAEQADAALDVLGGVPKPGKQVWVGVARLTDAPPAAGGLIVGTDGRCATTSTGSSREGDRQGGATESDGARVSPELPEKPQASRPALSDTNRWQRRAVMLCKDERFQQWIINHPDVHVSLGHGYEAAAACALRMLCHASSRAELATNPEAQKKFLVLEARFRQETGQKPKP